MKMRWKVAGLVIAGGATAAAVGFAAETSNTASSPPSFPAPTVETGIPYSVDHIDCPKVSADKTGGAVVALVTPENPVLQRSSHAIVVAIVKTCAVVDSNPANASIAGDIKVSVRCTPTADPNVCEVTDGNVIVNDDKSLAELESR
jgi:hypothetical protein